MPSRPRSKSPKQNASARTRESAKPQATGSEQATGSFFSFTLDAETGKVVKVEKLDAAGKRRKVPDRQVKTLVAKERARFEGALEEAFEAGIDCVLGGDDTTSETEESEQDAELRHVLVAPLIEDSPASRLLKRQALDRAMLGSLIQQSTNPAVPAPQAR
jgi:hypothetical protein